MAVITVHAPQRSTRLTAWLSRDGDSIVLALPALNEPLRFQEGVAGPIEGGPWEKLDWILRSTGK